MKSLESKWNDLKNAESTDAEAARVEDLMAFVRQNHVRYQLTVADITTGDAVPVAELGRNAGARLRVKITTENGGSTVALSWEPRAVANVMPLLRE